jgi:hypothetical protein
MILMGNTVMELCPMVDRVLKAFAGGPGCTYSAVLRNIHGDDTSFEASYAVLALQMLPHVVGFSRKEPPWSPRAEGIM